MARYNKLYEELKIRLDAWLWINVYCRSPCILCLYRQKTVQHWTEEAQSRLLLGRWWVVMSTGPYPIGCRRLLDLQPWGQVTLWGHCTGRTCRWNGLKRVRSEGDMSGHASLKEREKDVERLDKNNSIRTCKEIKGNVQLTWLVPLCIFKQFMRISSVKNSCLMTSTSVQFMQYSLYSFTEMENGTWRKWFGKCLCLCTLCFPCFPHFALLHM